MSDTAKRTELFKVLRTGLNEILLTDKEYLTKPKQPIIFSNGRTLSPEELFWLWDLFLLRYTSIYQIHYFGDERIAKIDFWEPYGWSNLLTRNNLMADWLAEVTPIDSITILGDLTLTLTNNYVLKFVQDHRNMGLYRALTMIYGFTHPRFTYKLGIIEICNCVLPLLKKHGFNIKTLEDAVVKLKLIKPNFKKTAAVDT